MTSRTKKEWAFTVKSSHNPFVMEEIYPESRWWARPFSHPFFNRGKPVQYFEKRSTSTSRQQAIEACVMEYEEVHLNAYDTVREARSAVQRWMNFYNERRKHQSLDRRTPDVVYYKNRHAQSLMRHCA